MNQAVDPEKSSPPLADEHGVAIRPALEVLSRLRGGTVMEELSLELNRVTNAVCETRKNGEVKLTLKLEKPKKGPPNAVMIECKIEGKVPAEPPGYDLMFIDDDGNLHTRNPNQHDMFEDGPRPAR